MNLLLIEEEELLNDGRARITGRKHTHVLQTLKSTVGDQLNVGVLNGKMGTGLLLDLNEDNCTLELSLSELPPKPLPLRLLLALPRPKMLRRVLQHAVAMGVKEITLLNAWKVEKSYWQTPWLSEAALYENCLLGLEQSKDTILPTIQLKKLFKPFVEDELADWSRNTTRLLAHPHSEAACPIDLKKPCTLAIGPEGGFTKYEVEKLQEQDFEGVHLGSRILRVETAVPALISRLYPAI